MAKADFNVPISPEQEQDIQALLMDAGDERDNLERLLRSDAQREANLEAAGRRVYREALERARDGGETQALAEVTARFARLRHDQEVNYDRQLRRTFNKGRARFRVGRDKAAATAESSARVVKPRTERLPESDRRYLAILGQAERNGNLDDPPLVRAEIIRRLRRYRPPRWSKTSTPLKVLAMSVVSAKAGAQTINLRPSLSTCADALRSARGPASYMQDRVRRSFERSFGKDHVPDFWMVVETDSHSHFHLHGAVITPAIDEGSFKVDAALREAGGAWESGYGSQYQQVSRPLVDPYVWAAYTCKNLNVGSLRIERRLLASTVDMKRLAETAWPIIRAELPKV